MFDYRPGDIFACVADIGWITGHSHALYGPLINGGTSVLFESIPIYPDPGERERKREAPPFKDKSVEHENQVH